MISQGCFFRRMLTLFVLPGLAASLEGGVMGMEPYGKHEGIRVFLLFPALVLGHAGLT